jgi:hypothetical protein
MTGRKTDNKRVSDLTEIYGNIIQSLHETAKEVLVEKHKRQSPKMWWTKEIEGLIEKKKKTISEMAKYKKI